MRLLLRLNEFGIWLHDPRCIGPVQEQACVNNRFLSNPESVDGSKNRESFKCNDKAVALNETLSAKVAAALTGSRSALATVPSARSQFSTGSVESNRVALTSLRSPNTPSGLGQEQQRPEQRPILRAKLLGAGQMAAPPFRISVERFGLANI